MVVLRSPATLVVAAVAAVLCALAVAGPALAAPGPSVTVRIEGETQTLLPRTQVHTTTDPVPMSGGGTCPGTSVAGAIDQATAGNWDRTQFTNTILGESHTFTHSDYWAEWLNNKYGNGICNDQVAEGDEVVMLVDLSDSSFAPTVFPVALQGVPAVAGRGDAFTVTVTEYRTDGSPGTGTPTPVAGATVSGGGATATTDGQGHATLAMPQSGRFTLRAEKSANARSASEPVCVHAGDDGTCGTELAAAVGTKPVDTSPAVASVSGIRPGQRFAAGRGPRLLAGTVDPGGAGVYAVRLRLRRQVGSRCWFYSARTERFRRGKCAATWFFYTIGDRPEWSYLLPGRLPSGRYVIDVAVMDNWGRLVVKTVSFAVARSRP